MCVVDAGAGEGETESNSQVSCRTLTEHKVLPMVTELDLKLMRQECLARKSEPIHRDAEELGMTANVCVKVWEAMTTSA